MITRHWDGMDMPLLGFGAMRLPVVSKEKDAPIDERAVYEMADYAYANGVKCFDTAHPYHGGESERLLGRILVRWPRDTWYLSTKYPGHQIWDDYNPALFFEEQMERCGADYFDFYMLHNVNESSWGIYTDDKLRVVDYFVRQKELGRIRKLGFSAHGSTELIERFLSRYDGAMAFCMIQLNYLDWTLQNAQAKYAALRKRGLPIWVMEPIHGGRLASLPEESMAKLKTLRPDDSAAAWALRFVQSLPGVVMILSGMSTPAQTRDNVRAFSQGDPLSAAETDLLLSIAETLKDGVPCTACGYCLGRCPRNLNIPEWMNVYNQMRFAPSVNHNMFVNAVPPDLRPSACSACGACLPACPQEINIPGTMEDFGRLFAKIPDWEALCRERAAIAKKTGARG